MKPFKTHKMTTKGKAEMMPQMTLAIVNVFVHILFLFPFMRLKK